MQDTNPSGKLVDKIIEHAEELPPFPRIVQKLMPLIQSMAPVKEIEAVIQYDPAIAARVIALSRSPLYARKYSVTSLRDAIVALGNKELIKVVLAACSARYFQGTPTGYDLREGELWEHSVSVAIMTDILTEHIKFKNAVTAYTAALLHDIGKTILHFHVKDEFENILTMVKKERINFLDAERRVLGIDHQQLGALIAKKWNLPDVIVAVVRFHHQPEKVVPKFRQITKLVHVANALVTSMGIGCGVDGLTQPFAETTLTELKISPKLSEKLLAEFGARFHDLKEFLGK
ncbi:MAG: HDOD domain-containing protein [Deltaproteobacteria bacterium]|nr:HDOD domain-containing protein [Deltaproteobacteria bacterium]MBW2068309.1 HDOD domain-containing protein [Deltaproteobacteria bacterium]